MFVTDKAVSLEANEGAKARLNQIESLMSQISQTKDPKGIEELQKRIQAEQATIQIENTKIQLMATL